MPGFSSILPTLHRRSSSIRERIRKLSLTSTASKHQNDSVAPQSSDYRPYSVYRHSSSIMAPPPAIAVLNSPEATQKILEAIFESANGRRALSRLARTCRAWLEPALNALWRELDSLAPVIGLFPTHLLSKRRRPGYGLATNPQEKDWDKILRYGKRVMKVTYDEIASTVSNAILPTIEEFRPTTYILPNLQHLTWKVITPDNLDYAALFLPPSLQGIVLHLNGAGIKFPTLPAFLADLGSRMKLQSLAINSSVGLPDNFTELLLAQDKLEKLSVVAPGGISPAVGKWAASLPRLQSLQLDVSGRSVATVNRFFAEVPSGTSTPGSIESHTDSGVFSGDEVDFVEIRKSLLKLTGDAKSKTVFPTLTQLQLSGEAVGLVTFLSHISSALTQLEITIEDPPNAADWRNLSAMISERFGSSLIGVRIAASLLSRYGELVRTTSRTAPAPSHLSLEYLSPLPAIRTFSVDLPESFSFTNADIAHLADMAPNLEELRLCPLARFPPSAPPQLTLGGLAPLMKNCRRLNALAVVINARPGAADPSASSSSLRWLHLGHSWISETLQVSILLSQLAPQLETIKWFLERNRPGFIEAHARAWQKVSETVPHLQNLRLMERRAAIPQKEIVVEYVEVTAPPAPRPSTAEKAIDATVSLADRAVDATPSTKETFVQVMPSTSDREMQAIPECASTAIDATPQTIDREVDATVITTETQVDATPQTAEMHVDATAIMSSAVMKELEKEKKRQENCVGPPSNLLSLLSLVGFVCRVMIAYPLSIPMRILNGTVGIFRYMAEAVTGRRPNEGGDMGLDTLNVRP